MVFLIAVSPANAQEQRTEKIAVLAAYAAIDYGQSCEAFFGAGRGQYIELNPILGRYPARRDLLLFGIAGLALTWAVSELFDTDLLLDSVVISEGWNIEENARLTNGLPRRMEAVPIIISWRF